MRRIDHGVFESRDGSTDAGFDAAGRRGGSDTGDLIAFAAFLGPELHRQGGGDRAADVIKLWADGDRAVLAEAETDALRRHHKDAAEILRRARKLATA
jgi:hypothetical protein